MRDVVTWTVVGVWIGDDPVPVGSFEGDTAVWISDEVSDGSPRVDGAYGGWAVQVLAPSGLFAGSALRAEQLAQAAMLRTLDRDDDKEGN